MNNTNILEKINRRARQIVRETPSISYRDAQKQAGLERREGVSGRKRHDGNKRVKYEAYVRRTPNGPFAWRNVSKKGYDQMKKMGFGPDKIRIIGDGGIGSGVGAKYRVKHVVEKIGASQVNQTRRQLEEELKAQRAWMLLAKDSATSKKARDKAARELAANKRELKAISGRGPSRKKKR